MSNFKRYIVLLSCVMLLFVSGQNALFAQGSDRKTKEIPEPVLYRFSDAVVDLGKDWVTSFIDSLLTEGKKYNGEKYECLANILLSYRAIEANDSVVALKYVNVVLEQTKRLHYDDLYFNELTNLVSLYMSLDNFYEAQITSERIVREAKNTGDMYALYSGYVSLGAMLAARENYTQSNEVFRDAIVCIDTFGDRGVMPKAQSLCYMAGNCIRMKDYKAALEYLQQSEQTSPTEPLVHVYRAICYWKQGDEARFVKCYDQMLQNTDAEEMGAYAEYAYVNAIRVAMDGNYDDAIAMVDNVKDPLYNKYLTWSEIYGMKGDWQPAHEWLAKGMNLEDSLRMSINTEVLNSAMGDLGMIQRLRRQEAELDKSNRRLILIGVGAFILFIAIIVTMAHFRVYQQRQKLRMLLVRRKTKELSSEREKAVRDSERKSAFLQNMSHDVRTPLNAILGFSQLLALPDGSNTQEEKEQYVNYISSNSEVLLMLVDDILNLSEIENGDLHVVYKNVACNDMCQNILKCVEFRAPDGVQMRFTSNVDDKYKIMTDRRRVQQVLVNFLTNACKHTSQGEIVLDCEVQEDKGTVQFSVIDTGEGVPADIRDNLFERFVQRGIVDSHGIGLNICWTIAEAMGGVVRLDTTYTKGAKFDFILHLVDKE